MQVLCWCNGLCLGGIVGFGLFSVQDDLENFEKGFQRYVFFEMQGLKQRLYLFRFEDSIGLVFELGYLNF